MDRGVWQATVHGVTRVGHDLVTNHHYQQPQTIPLYSRPVNPKSQEYSHTQLFMDIIFFSFEQVSKSRIAK